MLTDGRKIIKCRFEAGSINLTFSSFGPSMAGIIVVAVASEKRESRSCKYTKCTGTEVLYWSNK